MTRQAAKDFYEPQGGETVGYISALDAQNAIDTTYNDFESGDSAHVGSGDPHQQYQKEAEKAAASGYASLDAGTKVPIAQIPTGTISSGAGVFNVKDYGAVGDDSNDDTSEIQAALTAGAGATVLLPPGTYKISSALTVSAGTTITGPGTIHQVTAGTAGLDVGGSDVTVENVTLTGPQGTMSYDVGETAIDVTGPSAVGSYTNLTIRNVTMSKWGQYGVYAKWVVGFTIAHNTIFDIGYAGIGMIQCGHGNVTGNDVTDMAPGTAGDNYGIFASEVDGVAGTACYQIRISSNRVSGVSWEALDCHAGEDLTFVNNVIVNSGVGIAIVPGSSGDAPHGIIVANNIVDTLDDAVASSDRHYGFQFYGVGDGAANTNGATGIVRGNIFRRCNSAQIRWTEALTVDGNLFYQPNAVAIFLANVNVGLNITNNTIVDVWSDTEGSYGFEIGTYNTGRIAGNILRDMGTKSGVTYPNFQGMRILSATGVSIELDNNNLEEATDTTYGGAGMANTTSPAGLLGFYGTTPITKPSGVTAAAALQVLGLGTSLTDGGGSAHSIEDEGTPLTARSKLNFVGAGVAVTDDVGDDASVVTISAGSGGLTGVIDITADPYNAVGDGSDDGPAIRSAMAAAASAVGGTVYFPPGTYDVGEDGTTGYGLVPPSGITLDGPGTIRLRTGTDSGTRLIRANQTNVTMRNLTLDGNKSNFVTNEQQHGVFVTNSGWLFEHCTVKDFPGDAITFYTGSNDCTVSQCHILSCDRDGVTMNPGSGVTKNIRVIDNYIDVAVQAVDSEPLTGGWTEDILVRGNVLGVPGDDKYAITISGNGANVTKRWTVEGNVINGSIYFISSMDVLIANNVIDGAASYPAIRAYYYNENCRVIGNTIHSDSAEYAVVILVSGTSPKDWTIESNTIYTTNAAANGVQMQGMIGAGVIRNNRIIGPGNGANGIYTRATAVMESTIIDGNHINGYATGMYLYSTSGIYDLLSVENNQVVNTIGTPSFSYGIRFIGSATYFPKVFLSGNVVAADYGVNSIAKGSAVLVDGFYGVNPVVQPSGVTAAAALESLGLGTSLVDSGGDVNTVGASGAAETLAATETMHKITMDQDCTFTFTSPSTDGHAFILLLSGAYSPTWPGTVDWPAGTEPTYSSPSEYRFVTYDGGTTWLGALVGASYA